MDVLTAGNGYKLSTELRRNQQFRRIADTPGGASGWLAGGENSGLPPRSVHDLRDVTVLPLALHSFLVWLDDVSETCPQTARGGAVC